MEAMKEKFGEDHPDTLSSMQNLASTYRDQGRWQEAENLEVHVMEARKERLGADHLDTLTSMANLAFIYRDQLRWTEAFALLSEAVLGMQQLLGLDHPQVSYYMQEQVKMKDYLHNPIKRSMVSETLCPFFLQAALMIIMYHHIKDKLKKATRSIFK
jgi:hypothetical protein